MNMSSERPSDKMDESVSMDGIYGISVHDGLSSGNYDVMEL